MQRANAQLALDSLPGARDYMFQVRFKCEICCDSGWVRVELNDGRTGHARCECSKKRVMAEKLAQIPERFKSCTFDSYIPRSKTQTAAKADMQDNPAGSFYLWGGYGRGKTHLLFAQYRELLNSPVHCLVRTTREIVSELTKAETDRDYASPLLEAIHSNGRVHLFWDDCDKLKVTDFKLEVLFDLVDTIYRRSMAMTLTSNCELLGQLQEILGPSVVRRIYDTCKQIEL